MTQQPHFQLTLGHITVIIGTNHVSPVSMIAPNSRYASLSNYLSRTPLHRVYFDNGLVQGMDSESRFVEMPVYFGVSDHTKTATHRLQDLPTYVQDAIHEFWQKCGV